MTLLDECIAAHGGKEAFTRLRSIDLRLRCGGMALASKLRGRALAEVAVHVDMREPAVCFDGLGAWTADMPRPRGMPWRAPWRDEDVAYFAGMALWNYLAAPFLWSDCRIAQLPGRRLELTFPADVPTHSRRQVAHLDAVGRIKRLDYTAEVFGRFARARNVCLDYESWAGVLVPVRRRVTPRGLSRGPTLVSIDLELQRAWSSPGAVRYRSSR